MPSSSDEESLSAASGCLLPLLEDAAGVVTVGAALLAVVSEAGCGSAAVVAGALEDDDVPLIVAGAVD